ncbi:hypothetical protein SO802_022013 [Lithocarpus litseifolius]|uniref:Inositol 1,3,4-trisphosphate 5/6-kinase ATP-grasp domain-containing protein n=1 Tax=Lithocarpus litseifolius TaxID=425828 RepID=A0AAW2CIF8_9ROSI
MCPPPDGPPHEMVDSTPISSEQGDLTASVTMANKQKRGRNLCTKFKKLRENGLILITIPLGAKGPVGENASVFTRRANFTLDPNRVEDKMCMEISLSNTYNNCRSNYYKEYLKFSKEEVRANVPPDLTQDNWNALCDLYETNKWKVNDLGNVIGLPLQTVLRSSFEGYAKSTNGGSSLRHKRDQKRARSHSFVQLVVRCFSLLDDVCKRELSKNASVYHVPGVSYAAASADDADLDLRVAVVPQRPLLEKLAKELRLRLVLFIIFSMIHGNAHVHMH